MTITQNERNKTVFFDAILPGQVFQYENDVYMKLSCNWELSDKTHINAIDLKTGRPYGFHVETCVVRPFTATLNIEY